MRSKTRLLFVAVFTVALFVGQSVIADDYSETCSVTGGSAQRLSAVLVANGYAGPAAADVITVCNPTSNAADIRFGRSNVNSTHGFPLAPGVCYTWPPGDRPTDTQGIFLWTSSTQSAYISLRSR